MAQPYTDKTLENLPKGKKNVLVICHSFSSDCVETLEEISIQGKSFLKMEERILMSFLA